MVHHTLSYSSLFLPSPDNPLNAALVYHPFSIAFIPPTDLTNIPQRSSRTLHPCPDQIT